MQWTVGLRYDGVLNPDHGPVTQNTDERITWHSVMSCGNYPGGYTVCTLLVEADTENDAHQLAEAAANLWAKEVDIPIPATVLTS